MKITKHNKRPVVLVFMDGFGIGPLTEGNLFNKAETPFLDKIAADYPIGVLKPAKTGKTTPAAKRQLAYLTIGSGRQFKEKELEIGLAGGDLIYPFFPAVISQAGLSQAFIAETEKYTHLTEFLTGGLDSNLPLKELEKILVPSIPWEGDKIALFMAAKEINRRLRKAISKGYDFIAVSYANIEAAILTADFAAGIKEVEIMDKILSQAVETILKEKGIIILTSAYGGAESMVNIQTGEINRPPTSSPVPLMVVGEKFAGRSLGWPEISTKDLDTTPAIGELTDIAPTILKIFGLIKPKTMIGHNLL